MQATSEFQTSDWKVRKISQLRTLPSALPMTLKLIGISVFFPIELSFFLFGLRLTVIRVMFLAITPFLGMRWATKISSGQYRFVVSDLIVLIAGFWMILAPANVDGLSPALNHAGPDVLEFCIGYLASRLTLSGHNQAVRFIELICQTIGIIALVGLLDPLTNHYVTHDLASLLTGYPVDLDRWDDSHRLGLLRAAGPIDHPILFGFTCGTALLFAVFNQIRWKRFVIAACLLGTLFSFSSAPVFVVLLGFVLLLYDRIAAPLSHRWLLLAGLGITAICVTFLISNNPIGFIISHFLYSPESGYYREWTWSRVLFYVSQSPWFGLGFGPVPGDIDHSIDSLWLVLAIHGGFLAPCLFALSMLGAALRPASGSRANLSPAESRLVTTLGIVIFLTFYISFTVDLWGTSWVLTALLIGVRAHLSELGSLARRPISQGDLGKPGDEIKCDPRAGRPRALSYNGKRRRSTLRHKNAVELEPRRPDCL